MTGLTIATVGNPNCGKTTLFNALTGSRQKVGNWPGVTVDRKEGTYVQDGQTVTVVDLPGTYSLGGLSSSGLDEAIARDYILSGEPGLIVNVVDAANLERNLYLTAQLIEMRVPVIVALNMTDVATDHGIEIDVAALSAGLGCPVVPLVASRSKGIEALRKAIAQAGRQPAPTKRLSLRQGGRCRRGRARRQDRPEDAGSQRRAGVAGGPPDRRRRRAGLVRRAILPERRFDRQGGARSVRERGCRHHLRRCPLSLRRRGSEGRRPQQAPRRPRRFPTGSTPSCSAGRLASPSSWW